MSTLVNDVPFDFCSMEFEISSNGESFGIMTGIESVDYKETFNRTKYGGTNRQATARTDGDSECEGSLTFYQSWWDYLAAKAAELKQPLALLEMTITINKQHRGEVMHTDTLTGVKLGDIGSSGSKGPDPLMVTCSLDVMNIYRDGVDAWGKTL